MFCSSASDLIYDGMLSLFQTLNYYYRCGFIPVGFYPVNTLGDTGVSPEFDVLLKRFRSDLRRDAFAVPDAELLLPMRLHPGRFLSGEHAGRYWRQSGVRCSAQALQI